ncbi:MAG: YbaK/EbsC family protein [Pseudomonadota bacterium]
MSDLKPASQRVQDQADKLGLLITVKQLTDSTRTADEAAEACGCTVAQIVKSLVFRGKESNEPVLLLVSGNNRVNEKKAADYAGEKLQRPDAEYVREITGFTIGGIPPFAHTAPLRTFIDQDLLQHEVVWAAAGTPNSVFAVEPKSLANAVGAQIVSVS